MKKLALMLAAAMGIAGCGTTVHGTVSQSQPAQLAPGLTSGGVPTGTGPSLTSTGSQVTAGGQVAVGGVQGSSSTPGLGSSNLSNAGGGATAGTSRSGDPFRGLRGVTEHSIRIGVEVAANAAAVYAAFGAKAPTGPSQADYVKAIVSYLNKHGGVGGRQIDLRLVETDITRGTFSEQAQQACSALVEDNKVFLAISFAAATHETAECVAKKHTIVMPYLYAWPLPLDMWDKYADYVYAPSGLSYPRAAMLADSWHRLGLLAPSHKIGIISADEPIHQAYVNDALKPRLNYFGTKIADDAVLSTPRDFSGIGQTGAEISNTVLKFRSDGIDVVLYANTGGGTPLIFAEEAQNQDYHPTYGLSTFEEPAGLQGQLSAAQLHDSGGAGWLPTQDIANKDKIPPNPLVGPCMRIFTSQGMPRDEKNTRLCEAFWTVRDVLAAMYNRLQPTFRSAFESLGAYHTPFAFSEVFARGRRHDGIASYRDFRYNDSCSCFAYLPGAFAVPPN